MNGARLGGVIEDLAIVLRARGVRTLLFGASLMAAWVALMFYLGKSDPAWLLDGLLWAGEILFFWGMLQFVAHNLSRTVREARRNDRRIQAPGRRSTDRGDQA